MSNTGRHRFSALVSHASRGLLVALCLSLLLASCSKKPEYEEARLSVEPEKADFGVTRPGDPIAFRDVSLTIRNLGRQPLEIEKIELPDGFTCSIAPSNIVEAGETASVKIIMDTRKFSGAVSQTAYVFSNDPVSQRVPILLEARIEGSQVPQIAEVGAEPDIEFDHKTADLGAIPRNEMLEHHFSFKNVGKKPLAIYSVETLCVCVSGRPTIAQVPAGESAAIVARVEPYRYEGNAPWKTLTVQTNDPDEPIINLTISAKIVDPVSLEPEVVLFPSVRSGRNAHAEVKLVQRANQKLVIKEIKTSSPKISAAASDLEGDQKGYLLRITLSPDMPVGKFEEKVTIFTNYASFPSGAEAVAKTHKDYSKLELPVKGAVTGSVSVAPEKINFGFSAPGKPIQRKLVVSSPDSSFDIKSLSLSDPSFRVTYAPLGPKRKYEVTIEFIPGSVEQQIESKLVIQTTDAVLEVPIYAAVKLNS